VHSDGENQSIHSFSDNLGYDINLVYRSNLQLQILVAPTDAGQSGLVLQLQQHWQELASGHMPDSD